jgi:serine/threonine protein kinase
MSDRLRSFGDRWNEIRKLDRGGQGATFLVSEASEPSSQAALKELANPKNPRRVERFRRKVAALQKLDHHNVSRILDASVDTQPYFFVMTYYAGGTLTNARLYEQNLSRIFDSFGRICDGVNAAHNAEIHSSRYQARQHLP